MAKKENEKVKVLVADDSSFIRMVIKEMLHSAGFTDLIFAANANEALDLCSQNKPNVALLDMNLGDGDGLNVLRKMKLTHPEISCVMISAIDQADLIQKAKRAGAVDYVKKPFHAEQLVKAVETAAYGEKTSSSTEAGKNG